MKLQEIREKTLEEVKDDLLAAQENLRTLRFQLVTSQLENTSLIGIAKKDIAKLHTVIKENELGKRELTVSEVTVGEEEE